jgi:hypothetical protein
MSDRQALDVKMIQAWAQEERGALYERSHREGLILRRDGDFQRASGTLMGQISENAQTAINQLRATFKSIRYKIADPRVTAITATHTAKVNELMVLEHRASELLANLERFEHAGNQFLELVGRTPIRSMVDRELVSRLANHVDRWQRITSARQIAQAAAARPVERKPVLEPTYEDLITAD